MAETHMIVHLIYPNSTPLSPSFTICPARSPTLGVHIVIGQDGIRCNAFVLGWRIPMHHGDEFDP